MTELQFVFCWKYSIKESPHLSLLSILATFNVLSAYCLLVIMVCYGLYVVQAVWTVFTQLQPVPCPEVGHVTASALPPWAQRKCVNASH